MGLSATASRLSSRVLGGVLTLGLAVALLAAPSSDAPAPDQGVTDEPPVQLAAAARPSPTYRTFTLNVEFSLSAAKARADMERAFTLGDAGGLQEMSGAVDRATLIQLCNQKNWGYYMPPAGGITIPIIWNRSRFRLIDARTVKTHGAESGVTPSRWINVVRLRELSTGKVFGLINTHTIAQASRDAQATNMHRIPRLRRHLQILRAQILSLATTTEHVFISGDLNVNYLADRRRQVKGLPTDELGDIVSFDMPLTGSRGPRSLLDYGMSLRDGSGLQRTSARIARGFNSDHDAVVVTYRPVDLFETGPLFNIPGGRSAERLRVVSRQVRAIDDAEPGSVVRLATQSIDDPALIASLLRATASGVSVRVVLGRGQGSAAESRLAAVLGQKRSASSWLVRCSATCLGGSGTSLPNFLMVSRSGGTSSLTLVASGPALRSGAGALANVYRSSDQSVYTGYGALFDRMSAGTGTLRPLRTGGSGAEPYPLATGSQRDPVMVALRPVTCTGARGLRTSDGRTNVRAVVQSWAGSRGAQIAERLVRLQKRGCDVAVVAGPSVRPAVRRILAAGGVPLRRAAVGGSLLVVDGHYGRQAGAYLAWTGGPAWTNAALVSDGVTVIVREARSVRLYLNGFTQAWRS